MKLTTAQITNIILNNPNKDLVNKGKATNKLLRKHMYGALLADNMDIIEGLEPTMLHKLRKRYCNSNKDLFARAGRPIDLVYSATGGSSYYNMSEAQNSRAAQIAANIRDGLSARKWAEKNWTPHYLDDPCGVIMMEIGDGGNYPLGKVYPTYKAISTIYDYQPKGTALEYISFKLSDTDKVNYGITSKDGDYYRLVDDLSDYIIKSNGKEVTILNDFTLPNYFRMVPAMINSDIIDPNCDGSFLSLFDSAMELAEDYLQTGSIRKIVKLRHGFPKYWEYGDECPACERTGLQDGEKCKVCDGSGHVGITKVNQMKILSTPESKEDVTIAPNVGGYIEPSEVYHKISTEDLAALEDAFYNTIWGTQSQTKTQGANTDGNTTKTATEIVTDLQPMANRLNEISDTASARIKFIVDMAIRVEMKMPNYGGASISLGRRFMLETPDTLWKKYSDARTAGASYSVLNELLMEYLNAKYNSDPVGLFMAEKLMYVEPLVHNTIQQVQAFGCAPEDYKAKLYFGEWLSTIDDTAIMKGSIEDLRTALYEYVAAKELPQPALAA